MSEPSPNSAAEAEVEWLAAALVSAGDDLNALAPAYDAALARLEHLSRASDPGTVERVLAGLGLAALPLDAPVGTLSGGQKTRLGLAALLLDDPQLLILDEPTNHLDVTALAWLEGWLRGFPGGALIVSHDRTFLDETVTRLVALDDQTGTARVFEGNYSAYAAAVRSALDKQWAQWRDRCPRAARRLAHRRGSRRSRRVC